MTAFRKLLAPGLALTALALTATQAFAGSDTFNRKSLGGTWVSQAGTLSVSGDALVGTTGAIGYHKPSQHNTAVSAVIRLGGTDLEYGALTLGSVSTGTNAFVKIQSQDGGGTFDHAAFYTANNGSGDFFALSSAVPSPAVLDVSFCGTVAKMRITSAAGTQVYTHDYATSFGPGAGVGTFGAASIDNFIAFNGGCGAAEVGAHNIERSNAVDRSLSR